ncbi:MAG TPA: arginine--tRNA ligase [Candidatus Binatia bacterium]|nr:arginine--tRNA ligase [Candidatus Binatia bacterium]
MQDVTKAVSSAVKDAYGVEIEPLLTYPEEKFGDYSTNVAMQLAGQLEKSPKEIADSVVGKLNDSGQFEKVEVAGPGFINITLKNEVIAKAAQAATDVQRPLAGQEILVEFGDPNPFKEMHVGHLYQLIVGDSIARLLESVGADVKRLSYHGDVGRHVAQAVWGMRQPGADTNDLGACYAAGAKAYEQDEAAKAEIDAINQHIYKHDDEEINKLYDRGRAQSLDSFDEIYKLLGIKFDKHYFESQSTDIGVKFVQDHRSVFKESDGALVYDGERAGLHTRVFITSAGLPTYETKDLGLAELKNQDYPEAARSIILTGNEQAEYFKVMLAALSEIDQQLAAKTTHLSNGFVSLSSGKMSSRSGNVYKAMELLLEVKDAVHQQYPDSQVKKPVTFAAVKYAFLKHRLGSDIVFDIKESVSLEGNSGPYLQYAHARAQSILQKAGLTNFSELGELQPAERSLARKLSQYSQVVSEASSEYMPHHITTYLYELSQKFNNFYEHNRVVNDERQATRLRLVKIYADVLNHGLGLLGIDAPERI